MNNIFNKNLIIIYSTRIKEYGLLVEIVYTPNKLHKFLYYNI